jgi:hypothetical protein
MSDSIDVKGAFHALRLGQANRSPRHSAVDCNWYGKASSPQQSAAYEKRHQDQNVLSRGFGWSKVILQWGTQNRQRTASQILFPSTHKSEPMTAVSQAAPTKYPPATSLG